MALSPAAIVDALTFSARSALIDCHKAIGPSPARLQLQRLGVVNQFGELTPLGVEVHKLVTRAPRRTRAHKFGAKACYVTPGLAIETLAKGQKPPADCLRFDSLREARHWVYLVQRLRAGEIDGLQRQVKFPLYALTPAGDRVQVATYVADFAYVHAGRRVVDDAKGVRTQAYRLKRRWFEAQEGIAINEV